MSLISRNAARHLKQAKNADAFDDTVEGARAANDWARSQLATAWGSEWDALDDTLKPFVVQDLLESSRTAPEIKKDVFAGNLDSYARTMRAEFGEWFATTSTRKTASVCRDCGQEIVGDSSGFGFAGSCPASEDGQHRIERQSFEDQFQVIDATPTWASRKKRAALNTGDIYNALRDERHNGFGYGVGGRLPGSVEAEAEDLIIQVANELGMDYEDLFMFLNSKPARWMREDLESTIPANKSETEGIIRKFLNQKGINDLRAEVFAEFGQDMSEFDIFAKKRALNEQSGHGESGLDQVEVTDDNANQEPMWPWELIDNNDPNIDESWKYTLPEKYRAAMLRSMAWTEDESDITYMAEKLMMLTGDAQDGVSSAPGSNGDAEMREIEDRLVSLIRPLIGDITDEDQRVLEDYNFHITNRAIDRIKGNSRFSALEFDVPSSRNIWGQGLLPQRQSQFEPGDEVQVYTDDEQGAWWDNGYFVVGEEGSKILVHQDGAPDDEITYEHFDHVRLAMEGVQDHDEYTPDVAPVDEPDDDSTMFPWVTGSKTAGIEITKTEFGDEEYTAFVQGLFGHEARDAFWDYVGHSGVGSVSTPHFETPLGTYIEFTPDDDFDWSMVGSNEHISSVKTGSYRLEFGSERDRYWVGLNINQSVPGWGADFDTKQEAVDALVEFFAAGNGGDIGGPLRVVPSDTPTYQGFGGGRSNPNIVGEGGWLSDGSWGLTLADGRVIKKATQESDEYLVDPDADVNAEPDLDALMFPESDGPTMDTPREVLMVDSYPGDNDPFAPLAHSRIAETNVDEDDAMWPWDLQEAGDGSADVADVSTPGQSEADYPQPKSANSLPVFTGMWRYNKADYLTDVNIIRSGSRKANLEQIRRELLSIPFDHLLGDGSKVWDNAFGGVVMTPDGEVFPYESGTEVDAPGIAREIFMSDTANRKVAAALWLGDEEDASFEWEGVGEAYVRPNYDIVYSGRTVEEVQSGWQWDALVYEPVLIRGAGSADTFEACKRLAEGWLQDNAGELAFWSSKTAGVPVEWPNGACYSTDDDQNFCVKTSGHEGDHDRRSRSWIEAKLSGGSAQDRNDAWASRKKATKAIAIYPDKRVEEVDIQSSRDIIGGMVAPIDLSDGSTMWVDDEYIYKYTNDDFNSIASDVAGLGGRVDLLMGGIKGPVVITGGPDSEGANTDVPESARRWVNRVSREAKIASDESGYDIFHDGCAQWHTIPGTGVVTCEVTGESFEIGVDEASASWPGELKDSDGFDRGNRIAAAEGDEDEEVDTESDAPVDGTEGELTLAEEVGADRDEGDPVDIETGDEEESDDDSE